MNFGLGLFLGIGVGINIGLWLGTYLYKKWNQPLIDDLKKSIDYWYKNSKEWQDAYYKEITQGYERVSKMLDNLKK